MEMSVISKVISLKMKTLIFAVICIYLNLNLYHHWEEHCIQAGAVSVPDDGKYANIIFMGIILMFCTL